MVKFIAKLIVALNGNVKASQIAAGFSWGLLLALVPMNNAFWVLLFFLSFVFKHHHGAKILVMTIIKLLSPLIVMPLDSLGWWILHLEFLHPYFTALSNTPAVLLTKFNNTLVMGGLSAGLVLFIPVYILMRLFVPFYRNAIAPKIRDSKLAAAIKKIPFVSAIAKMIGKAAGAEGVMK